MSVAKHRVSPLPVASMIAMLMGVAACDSGSTTTPDPIALSAQCLVAPQGNSNVSGSLADGVTAGSATRYNVTSNPSMGQLSYDATGGAFTYTPTTLLRGYRDSFTVEVTGSENGTTSSTVDIIFGAARIMPLGDSITYGVTSSLGTAITDLPVAADAVGYRKPLYERLVSEGYLVDFVGFRSEGVSTGLADTDHAGTPGADTTAISTGVNAWLNADSADIVLLHAGTNDINASITNASGIQDTLTAINTWVSQVQNPDADTLVARIVPSPIPLKDGRINDYNTSLDGIMSANWPDLTVVDMNAALDVATHMTPISGVTNPDTTGLHPNTAGYQVMADTWYTALTSNNKIHRCAS